ncbi:hypothetical protein CKA38_01090 [Ereboglobus luteus]|uniref:Uncharacterized protein n=1 Tax=Ereboglobus luteus TaxID=1796921 RepID=A0A2U8DZT3_9BACT|nr:hypothetical protein CKA38_01090 [Ereboglobus luteus]
MQDGQRIIRLVFFDLIKNGGREFIGITSGESPVDANEQFQEARTGFVLIKPGKSKAVGKFDLCVEAMMDQGNHGRLARSARADKKQVVFIGCKHAFAHFGHAVGQQGLTLDKDFFQNLGI